MVKGSNHAFKRAYVTSMVARGRERPKGLVVSGADDIVKRDEAELGLESSKTRQ